LVALLSSLADFATEMDFGRENPGTGMHLLSSNISTSIIAHVLINNNNRSLDLTFFSIHFSKLNLNFGSDWNQKRLELNISLAA